MEVIVCVFVCICVYLFMRVCVCAPSPAILPFTRFLNLIVFTKVSNTIQEWKKYCYYYFYITPP